jgi:hypothetical protein
MSMVIAMKSQAYPNQTSSSPLPVSRVEQLPVPADGREGGEGAKEDDSKKLSGHFRYVPFLIKMLKSTSEAEISCYTVKKR